MQKCLICTSYNQPFMSFGPMPLANGFIPEEAFQNTLCIGSCNGDYDLHEILNSLPSKISKFLFDRHILLVQNQNLGLKHFLTYTHAYTIFLNMVHH